MRSEVKSVICVAGAMMKAVSQTELDLSRWPYAGCGRGTPVASAWVYLTSVNYTED